MGKYRVLVGLLVLMLVVAACGGNDDDDDNSSTAAESPTIQSTEAEEVEIEDEDADVVEGTEEETSQDDSEQADTEPTEIEAPTATATIAPSPTATDEPQPTATPAPEDLVLQNVGFGQAAGSRSIGWSAILENPNSSFGLERNEYQVALLDANGTVIETDSGSVMLIFPEQRLGVSGSVIVDEGVVIESIDVQVSTGTPTEVESAGFTVEQPVFYADDTFPRAAGIIKNPYEATVTDLRVSFVPMNANGDIIGGGYTYQDIVPGSHQSVVASSMEIAENPASIEIFAMPTVLSDLIEANPETDIAVTKVGFGLESEARRLGYAAIIENPNTEQAVRGSHYQASFYDESGAPVASDSGSIEFLFPGATTATGSDLVSLADGVTVASIEVVLVTGDLEDTTRTEPFTSENVQFVDDSISPKVTGTIRNPYDQQWDDLRVVSVAYDENDNIIGGGYTYLDFVLAQGQASAEIRTAITQPPARVELYANPTILTEFE